MKLRKRYLLLWLASTVTFAKTPVVLLSIDGFAQRYFEQYQPTTLNKLRAQGTSAQALLPVFPSKTFPNHLSIVTGQYPQNHGIIHNSFFHRDIEKVYQLGDGKNNSQWLTAKPIWHLNEEQGNRSAVYFWPESETKVENKSLSYFYPYKHSTPNKDRLEQILNWLRLPESKRPNFIAGYFSTVDSAGHDFGEDSPELINAIKDIDMLIGEFIEQINTEFDGQVNLVIVSDHGMTKIKSQNVIKWQNMVATEVKAINGSTQLYLYSQNPNAIEQTKQKFLTNNVDTERQGYKVYQYPDYPEHWHLTKNSPVVPDMIIDAMPSYIFNKNHQHIDPETHGYDPKSQSDLNAIFIAVGPMFNKKKQVEAFENIHVLPIITRVLGLDDVKNIDGNYQVAEKVVKK